MAEFNDSHKAERSQDYFPFGVHPVKIIGFNHDKTDDGKEFIEVGFCHPENDAIEDKARFWFHTDGAMGYSFSVLKTIFVHNAPEDKKEAARLLINEVSNTDKLVELLSKKLIGKEAFFTKYYDPERTYTGKDNVVRRSVNKNLLGYQPKVNEALMPKKQEAVEDAAAATFPDAETPATPAKKGEPEWM